MVQELKNKKVAIIGAGPAGCFCAYFLQNDFDVTLFDKSEPLRTLLPTGGGRCNLAHAEFDFKELAENYPRGKKFLYSVFSKFSTIDTLETFEKIGIETYTQPNGRIFPLSNSAKDVRQKILSALGKCRFETLEIKTLPENFDFIVFATGGHASYRLAETLGHKIVSPKPALVGLITKEDFSELAGVTLSDVLFTHKGVSGPAIYKISSLKARESFPYSLEFNFAPELDLQKLLEQNSHKTLKNLLSTFLPKSFAQHITGDFAEKKCFEVNAQIRDEILTRIQHFKITAVGTVKDGETVTSGGIALNEVTTDLCSKFNKKVYFCGEILDIDGFCGGFNLQNCWSTAFVVAQSIKSASTD